MNSLQTAEITKNDDKSVKSGDVTPTICSKDQEIASPVKKTTSASSSGKFWKSSKTDVFIPENRFKLKPEQAYKKETKASRLGKSTGRWTQKEHILFMEGLKIYGKNWKRVESYIGTRTGTQIRSHAQKFFNRIRKEHGAEDPSKYVVENMCDERIKQLILEHCGDDVSSQNESKEFNSSDTPEVLFSITKEKATKRKKDEGESTPKSIGTPGGAFKSFKRQMLDESGDREDSKIHHSNTKLKKPIWIKPQKPGVQPVNQTLNQTSAMLNAMANPAMMQVGQTPIDVNSLLTQMMLAQLGGAGFNNFGNVGGQSNLTQLLYMLNQSNNIH